MEEIKNLKESLFERLEGESLEEIISYMSENIKIENESFIDKLNIIIKEEKIETIEELILLLEDIMGPVESSNLNINGVRVMTMHQAKGPRSALLETVAPRSRPEHIAGFDCQGTGSRRGRSAAEQPRARSGSGTA